MVPALHSNNRENFSVTSALRMGSKSAALLQERAVCATVRMYSHWKRMKILKMNDWKPKFVEKSWNQNTYIKKLKAKNVHFLKKLWYCVGGRV